MLALNAGRWARFASTAALTSAWGCAAEAEDAARPNRDEERVQAKVSACLGLDVGDSVAFFLPSRLGGIGDGTDARDCVRAADTCAMVKACGGYSPEPCPLGTQRCEDGVAFNCWPDGGALETRDVCDGAGNDRCSVVTTEREGTVAICHGAPCANDHCDGAVQVNCLGGWEVRNDCARDGRTCIETVGGPGCSHPDACTQDTCYGDELRLCAFGRVVLTAECARALPGSRCVQSGSSAECQAITPRPECSEHAPLESWCEGDIGVTCMAGVRSEVDCSVLAGGRCVDWRVGDDLDAIRAGCRASATEDTGALLLASP